MKKAFAVILSLSLLLAGCSATDLADSPSTDTFQINSLPTFSTEATEVTERLDEKETEGKLTSTETEATSGKVSYPKLWVLQALEHRSQPSFLQTSSQQ